MLRTGVACATVAACAAALISAGSASAFETGTLESYSSSPTTAPVFTSQALSSGTTYRVYVDGTYSPYEARQMAPAAGFAICGTPEAAPLFPTPGITNARTGRDSEFVYAYPLRARGCPAKDAAKLPRRQTMVRVSQDNGVSYSVPSFYGAAGEHSNAYTVVGNGNALTIKLTDSDYSDNSGQFRITIVADDGPIDT